MPPAFLGKIAVFQLLQSVRVRPHSSHETPPGQICADGPIPYEQHEKGTGDTLQDLDAPLMAFGPKKSNFYGKSTLNETFWDEFVYKPNSQDTNASGIWIKLAHLSWGWQAGVDYEPSGYTWTQKPQLSEQQPQYDDALGGTWTCPFE